MRTGETVNAVINDLPVSFRVDPDAVSVPTNNADTAARLAYPTWAIPRR
ncbi:MAG: hypothetical protein WBA68_02625 [Alteraurantiacibacter sp.]